MTDSPFGSTVLITGGAGFLGRGILRYIERERIRARVTVYSRDEHKHHALRARFPGVRCVLGDVRDAERLRSVMVGHDVVIHAGAMKHIPEAERDAMEAVDVNVNGSRSVFYAAMETGVSKVVAISTDKVTSPRNAYGATKMLMERCLQEAARLSSSTQFAAVRYGNVVSSTGSVVPLFAQQIEDQNEVTITSLDMTRFWLAIDDAVRLVEKALSAQRPHGSTFIAECPAMSVQSVAQAVWELTGRSGDVRFRLVGVRPGEKIHEVLLDSYEAPFAVRDGAYFVLPAALQHAGERAGDLMPYSSDHPARWMEPREMISLIKDARNV